MQKKVCNSFQPPYFYVHFDGPIFDARREVDTSCAHASIGKLEYSHQPGMSLFLQSITLP